MSPATPLPAVVPIPQLQLVLDLPIFITALAIALLVAIVSISISYLRVRHVSRLVHTITQGVRRMSQGNLGDRVEVQGSREIRGLAEALNIMADNLASTIQDLAGERDKLSAVLATMADGVVVVSPDGTVLMLNQAAREMLNVGQRGPEGRRLIEVVRDYQIHRLTSDCQSTGQAQLGEVELLRPRRFLNAVATPLREIPPGPPLPNGGRGNFPTQRGIVGTSGVLLTLHDLTRTRQMEASQRDFVTNVSHELRNPLASVKAMVETLEDGAVEQPEVARDFLRRVLHDVDRMNNLVNELLELSRLESGRLVLQLRPLDLAPVVEDVKSRFNLMTEEKDISVTLSFPTDLPPVMADEDRVRQVIINLVENAIKFTPSNGQIKLSARRKSPQPPITKGGEEGPPLSKGDLEGFIEITVEDTGVGVPADDLPHLFERFYKVDRSRQAHTDGSGLPAGRGASVDARTTPTGLGLGLAIVKQIVEAHGGEVWAKSQEGAGSTFGFTLPVAG